MTYKSAVTSNYYLWVSVSALVASVLTVLLFVSMFLCEMFCLVGEVYDETRATVSNIVGFSREDYKRAKESV